MHGAARRRRSTLRPSGMQEPDARPALAAVHHDQVVCSQRTGIVHVLQAKGNGVTANTCGQREAAVRFDLLGLEEPVRREVLALAASRRFARGVVLFHEGEAGGSLHVLMRGRASVWVTTPSGDTVTLNVIGPGTAFGELSLLHPDTERTATVQAIEPVQTLVLHRA